LWLKADAGITLNGSNVLAWADQSGNGYKAVQSLASFQPLFVPNDIYAKNKPTIKFGNNKILTGAKINDIDNKSLSCFIASRNDATSARGVIFSIGNTQYWISKHSDGGLQVLNKSTAVYSSDFTDCDNNGTPMRIYSLIKNINVSHKVYVDGVMKINVSSGNFVSGITSNIFTIGKKSSGADSYLGNIAEIILYDTDVDTNGQAQVENYLKTKYSIV
jgi:hypothetical protein